MSVFRLRRSHPRMSTLGHKQTLEQASEMSALPPKADMLSVEKCLLSAKSGHPTCSLVGP